MKKAFENPVGNGENAGYQNVLHFSQCLDPSKLKEFADDNFKLD